MRVRAIIAVLAFAFLSAQAAQAEIILSFSDDAGQTFKDRFLVDVGGTTTIGVYAMEVNSDNTLSTDGLSVMGFLSNFNNDFGSVLSIENASQFSFQTDTSFDNGFGFMVAQGRVPGLGNVMGESVLLAEFDFQTQSIGTTNFVFSDRNTTQPNFVSGTGTDLDPVIFGAGFDQTYSMQIAAVPEPTSVGCLVALGGLAVLRRRKKKS